ncbi:MAG TPA: type II secretion system F family protein [Dehalococcoidia bacterium]|nr:type II secretion system F family protein [Dehalococcoidia bacterium]
MEERLQTLRSQSRIAEDQSDLGLPFTDRVLRPMLTGSAGLVSSFLPTSMLASLERQLILAGSPVKASTFATFWVGSVIGLFVFALFVAASMGNFAGQGLLIVLVLGLMGFMLPRIWLLSQIQKRQKAILKSLPDALDLITTCVEAGLGLDGALTRVTEKIEGPLAEEMSQTLREIAMGRLRRDALAELGERTGVEDLILFINSIIQAEQLGVGIAQVLRVQSDQMRTRRRQRAEKAAHEAPIKMLFPLVFFVFPAFLVVILGPGMIRISQQLGGISP